MKGPKYFNEKPIYTLYGIQEYLKYEPSLLSTIELTSNEIFTIFDHSNKHTHAERENSIKKLLQCPQIVYIHTHQIHDTCTFVHCPMYTETTHHKDKTKRNKMK